jgi:inner membrane protein involved in colicin E2 resistance
MINYNIMPRNIKFIILFAAILFLALSIFLTINYNSGQPIGPLGVLKDILNRPEKNLEYSIRIDYDGSWSGYASLGSNKHEISGVGPQTINIKGNKLPLTAHIQKNDFSHNRLTVYLLKNNTKIESGNTSAGYGKVDLTFIGDESD